ncbi:MAG: hypothetical protein AAF567_21625 [Actinomycetota bacterium]
MAVPSALVIEVHGATVLLMWATGGLLFLWVTTRRREVGIGYGWTMRITYIAIAAIGVVTGIAAEPYWPREILAMAMIVASSAALFVSWQRRRAGVAGQREVVERRSERVAQMTGIDRDEQRFDREVPEFPPLLDLIAPLIGVVGLIAAAVHAGGPSWLAILRVLAGAAFLGAVSDAMLLGHWYLVQPGLARAPILELVRWTAITWVPHTLAFILPTGMLSVLGGSIDDGYGGALGWFWLASTVTTIALVGITRAALRERQYSAVMAATGLLYLAILTAFGQDLVARILLSPDL